MTRHSVNIHTHTQVFVERQPLMKSEEQIISSLTAVVCGMLLLLAYLLHSYFIKNQTALLRRLHALKHPHSHSI